MKLPLPLYARIAGWFLLNLLLVGLIVFFFSRQYFSLESLVAGPAGDRITTLATLAGENLRNHSDDEWPNLLEPLKKTHQLEFYALRNDGEPFANQEFKAPEKVLIRLHEFNAPMRDARPEPPGRRGPGRGMGPGLGPGRGPGAEGGSDDPVDLLDRGPPDEADHVNVTDDVQPVRAHLLFALQDEHGDYWFANRVGLGRPSGSIRRPHSVILLIKSPSLDANGLILDTRPWWRMGIAIIAISILLWVPFAWNLTRYIRQLTRRTVSIARGNFDANEISHRGDELGRLGMAIDRLRQRLSGYVDGQKRFTSDIAHELCTPLARMQLSLGVLEQQTKTSPETIEDLRDEVKQMSSMVDELLDFSRAQISPDKVSLETVNLSELIQEVIAREGASTATVDIRKNTQAKASPHLLRRAVGNVVRNAIRHAPGKDILIHTSHADDTVEIFIDDEGPGIPEEHLSRIFEPFYRVDTARTREEGGTGLGLAIVSTCMEGCGGTASCENLGGQNGTGLRVILTLPDA